MKELRTPLPAPRAALAFAAVVSTPACSPSVVACTEDAKGPEARAEYVLVEYRTGAEIAKAPEVEVRDTPQYKELREQVKAAAIRLPDSCLNEGASEVTGVSKQAQTIFQTTCGPWLSEIEKALSAAGFRVFSWDALRKLEKEKNMSTYTAGKELGADIVFVFNSLEAGDIKGGATSQGKFRYFSADAQGNALAPKPLDDQTRAAFKGLAQSVLKADFDAEQVLALSSIVDATAVATGSGESVWFYRRTVTIPVQSNAGMKFLFGRYLLGDRPLDAWVPVPPERPQTLVQTGPAPVQMSTEDTVQSSVGTQVDPFRARRLELIRTGAAEFVSAFKKGKGGAS